MLSHGNWGEKLSRSNYMLLIRRISGRTKDRNYHSLHPEPILIYHDRPEGNTGSWKQEFSMADGHFNTDIHKLGTRPAK